MNESERELRSSIIKLQDKKERYELAKKEYQSYKQHIHSDVIQHIKKSGYDSFIFKKTVGKGIEETHCIKEIKPISIEFNGNELEKALCNCNKEHLINKCITKEYKIKDWSKLVDYLISINADSNIVLNLIECVRTVNVDAVNQLTDLKELTKEELKGTYKVVHKQSYLKISKIKLDE